MWGGGMVWTFADGVRMVSTFAGPLASLGKAFVAGLAVMSSVAAGHGFLERPAARNVQLNSGYCPSCLNAGGTSTVYAAGLPGRYGVCGDPWNGPKPHERFVRVAGTYRRGGTVRARTVLTANHLGRWGLKLCPFPRATQACFDAHPLLRTNGKPFVRVTAARHAYEATFRLPRGLTCSRCVLQWTYETANSCNLPGSPWIPGVSRCRESANWERFWNCADIEVT